MIQIFIKIDMINQKLSKKRFKLNIIIIIQIVKSYYILVKK